MFERYKPRYMTRAVADTLSEEHLQFILRYVDERNEQMTDYLQVFEFYVQNHEQWLVQRQEQPERETTVFVPLEKAPPIEQTVWVMDQQDHVIVLFPSCY
ncbi:hypothetical protein CS060_13135 [Anoxybacillus flavithermus]|uniref:DUF960 domain-containing protein n=1 Tax=Anoxybacillus flavithermus TaxID=33934 RepID=A0A2G5RM73_9BACL|nr:MULTISPECIES: DUF960 family protein [Anoxybacillus]KFZ43675.1 hypothetical protein JS80_01845 [Anoxybacillus sp. KU2-6(11)]PIC03820.1 hypothetical protein CS060_13135 [Anoxybacillus flavithermus]